MKSATCAALLTLGLGWFRPEEARAELTPLRTAATLSARPTACTPRTSARANVWQSARAAGGSIGRKLCAHMAEISRVLATDPAKAARLLEQALGAEAGGPSDAVVGFETSFRLLQARVAFANGRAGSAFELFHRTATTLPISEWDPGSLRDYGVSAAHEGRHLEAALVYRRLVAVSSWLDVPTRNAVRIEATMAVLRLPEPDTVEALGYLSGLDGQESDSSIATLGMALHTLTSALASRAAIELHPIAGSVSELRQLARLPRHDVRLLETWVAWTHDRKNTLWNWTRDEGVPQPYRALAVKLESGG